MSLYFSAHEHIEYYIEILRRGVCSGFILVFF